MSKRTHALLVVPEGFPEEHPVMFFRGTEDQCYEIQNDLGAKHIIPWANTCILPWDEGKQYVCAKLCCTNAQLVLSEARNRADLDKVLRNDVHRPWTEGIKRQLEANKWLETQGLSTQTLQSSFDQWDVAFQEQMHLGLTEPPPWWEDCFGLADDESTTHPFYPLVQRGAGPTSTTRQCSLTSDDE